MNKGYEHQLQYSYMWINAIIQKEEVVPFVARYAAQPDWNKLNLSIKRKYKEPYATMNVNLAKIDWFGSKRIGKAM